MKEGNCLLHYTWKQTDYSETKQKFLDVWLFYVAGYVTGVTNYPISENTMSILLDG